MRASVNSIFNAANSSDWSGFLSLLDEHLDVTLRDDQGQTLLLALIRNSSLDEDGLPRAVRPDERIFDCLEAVLRLGADPNVGDQMLSQFPLHEAVLRGAYGIVQSLLRHRADPNRRLQLETHFGTDSGYDEAPLHIAAGLGLTEIARLLCEHGATIDIGGYAGQTPLHVAAKEGRDEVLQLLLTQGANIQTGCHGTLVGRFMSGETPLHVAVAFLRTSTVQTLLSHGASVDTRDASGRTPLDILRDKRYRVKWVLGREFPNEDVAIIERSLQLQLQKHP